MTLYSCLLYTSATAGLAALFVIHIIYAFWLTMQNRAARGSERYAVNVKPKTVAWASQNMLVLGIIVIAGLALHFANFWYKMQFAEIIGVDVYKRQYLADSFLSTGQAGLPVHGVSVNR